MNKFFKKSILVFLGWMLFYSVASAGVVINATRVIFNESDDNAPLRLNNAGQTPSLVQAWVDSGNAQSTPDTADAPFLIVPPIFRLDPEKSQTIRIAFTEGDLPKDKESVFWLNVLEVPPKPRASEEVTNYLQIAFRYRIKLFYRPKALKEDIEKAVDRLVWRLEKSQEKEGEYQLLAKNGSAYHITVATAKFEIEGKSYEVTSNMVPPGGSVNFPVKDLTFIPVKKFSLEFNTINDYGMSVNHKVDISP